MADETFGIVVEIDPSRAKTGKQAVDRELADLERHGKQTGQAIGDEVGKGFKTAAQEAKAAAATARQAAREQAQAQRQAAREAAQAARQHSQEIAAASRAAANAGKIAAREEAQARKAAAAEAAKAAREAQAAQAKAAAQAAQAERQLGAVLREIQGPAADFNAKLRAANQLLERGSIDAQQYARYINKLQAEMSSFKGADKDKALDLISLPTPGKKGAGAGAGSGLAAVAGRALPAIAAAVSVREVIDLGDAYTNLGNRLSTVTNSEAELARVQAELFRISERTRTSVEASAQLYSTFGKGILDTGRSHAQVLPIIESVQQAVKLSGASAQAAEAALIQLGQGMSAGALRGEELNSILEQAPVIADVIAKQLGVTRGQLRALGAEGKLTSEVIIKAFEAQREEIAGRFAKTVPTVSEQIVVFRNEAIKLAGEFSKNANLGAVVGKVLKELVDVLKGFGEIVGGVVGGIRAVNDALGGVPLKVIGELGDKLKYTIPLLGQYLALRDAFANRPPYEVAPDEDNVFTQLRKELEFQQRVRDLIENDPNTGFVEASPAPATTSWFDAPAVRIARERAEAAKKAAEEAAKEGETAAKRQAEAFARLRDETDRIGAAQRELAAAEDLVGKAVARNLPGAERANEILERKRELLADQLNPLGAVLRGIERETQLLGLNEGARERIVEIERIRNDLRQKGVELGVIETAQLAWALEKQRAATKASEDSARVLKIQKDILDGLSTPQRDFNETLAAYNDLLEEGKITQEQYNEALGETYGVTAERARQSREEIEETEKSIAKAAEEAAEAAKKPMEDLRASLEQTFSQGFNSALESLIDFSNTTKETWKNLALDISKQIGLILAKMALLRLARAIGGDTGGIISGLVTGQFGGTNGGNRAAGGSFIVGGSGGVDSQPVFLRATPGERVTVTPPGQSAAMQSPNVNVPVKAVVVDNRADAMREMMNSSEFSRAVLVVLANNPGKVRGALQS